MEDGTNTSSGYRQGNNDESHAKELLAQIKYLLDDERSFAAKLVDDRKMKLSLLAVVVGLGFFKIESIQEVYQGLSQTPVAKLVFNWAFFIGLASLIVSAYLIALERDPTPITRWTIGLWRWVITKLATFISKLAKKEVVDKPVAQEDPREVFSAALVVLYGSPSETDQMGPELQWLTQRIEEARLAYTRLAAANRRVRKRLERGSSGLLVAFTSVIVVIGAVLISAAKTPTDHAEKAVRRTSDARDHYRADEEVRPRGGDSEDSGPAAGNPSEGG